MKRKLLLTTLLLMMTMGLFAGMSYIGVNTGYAFTTDNFVQNIGEGSELKTVNKSQSVPVILDGGSYFTKSSFDIGISYGATLLSFRMTEGGAPTLSIAPYIGFSLKYNFNETFFITGMLGADYRSSTGRALNSEQALNDSTIGNISFLLDFNGGMNLFSRLMLKAGLRAGFPVYTPDNSAGIRVSGYSILPYAGLSIIY